MKIEIKSSNNITERDVKMDSKSVNLDDFCKWLINERESLENNFKEDCASNQTLLKRFLEKWSLDRLKNLGLHDYIQLCKDIDRGGDYSDLYMSIAGGTPATKFLISKNSNENVYKIKKGSNEDTIEEEDATIYFNELRKDLVDIIQKGINLEFDEIKSTNRFYNCSAMIIKLLSIYSNSSEGEFRKPSYFSFNNNKNEYQNIFNRFLPNSTYGVYRQNHEITKYVDKQVPNLDQVILSYSIQRYVKAIKKGEEIFINKQEREKNKMLYSDILKKSRNLILRGAPGTGKTYLAKEIAAELTGGNEDQIGFVQFHPSYDYTDFVEGLRPVSNGDGAIEFKLQDGIFKEFCQKAKEAQKTGGQDNFEETWAKLTDAINEKQGQYFFPRSSVPASLNSQGNVKFDSPVTTKEKVYLLYKGEETKLKYETYQKIVLDHMKESYGLCDYVSSTINTDKKFVFIIDEINRGEISKIFGELFFSIDKDYRGEKGSVSTQYANLHESDEKFYIPENVYIIGTMNDIDRSVDTFDFAMRRRFRFVEVTAESQLYILDNELDGHEEEAKKRLRNLNAAIENVQELNSHYHIGPSYFRNLKELDYDYELLWSDYLKPLLEDYLRGSYEETETLDTLKKAFDLTNNEQTNQQETGDNDADN